MSARRRWILGLARLCLLTWPAHHRLRHGPAVLATLGEELDERAARPARNVTEPGSSSAGPPSVRWGVAQCLALVRSGLAMRGEAVLGGARRWTTGMRGDGRVALRGLRRSPGFTLASVATLAVGVGGTAAVLGTVDRVLIQPPPYDEPERLALVWNTLGEDPGRIRVAAPDVAVLRDGSGVFDGIAFVHRVVDGALSLGQDGAEHVRVASVTYDLFDLLGVEPAVGRSFQRADGAGGVVDGENASGPPVVLLAHGVWTSRFAADPGVVGREVRLDGLPAVVVGVLPEEFALELPPDAGMDADADVWVPLRARLTAFRRDEGRRLDQDSDNTGVAIARLAPGVRLDEARREVERIWTGVRDEVPSYRTADLRIDLRPMVDDAREHARGVTWVLVAGAVALLLVTCLNIATLVMARTARRGPELTVRLALGSGRSGLARALVLENLMLAGLGALAAFLLADALAALLMTALPAELAPRGGGKVGVGPFVIMAGALSFVLLVVFGTGPAVGRAGLRMTDLRSRTHRRGGLRAGLVGVQIALAVALTTGSLVLGRSAERLRDEHPGFVADGALTFSLSVRMPDRYRGPAERARLMDDIRSRLSELPGVSAVGVVGGLPLSGSRWTQPYGLPGQAEHEWAENRADFRVVTSGLFDALGVGVLEGRGFTRDEDLREDGRVVVVDRRLAQRVAPEGSALGRHIGFPLDGDAVTAEIVGVVERVRYDELTAFGREAIYVPYRQEASRDIAFVVRSRAWSPEALDGLAADVRRAVRAVDPELPVYDLRTMTDYVEAAQGPIRFALWLVVVFAGLTLLASAVGVWGVVSFDAGSRTRDLGLRVAVGASSRDIQRLMLRRGVTVALVGGPLGLILCGVAAAFVGARLPGVSFADPVPWVAGGGMAVLVAVAASWWPAVRASRVDPTQSLRAE